MCNQLRQWVMEPDLGVKSFTDSMLSMSGSICLPYHGVLLHRAHNPCGGFVFHTISCTRNCSNRKHCSQCASKINTMSRKIRHSIEPAVECAKKWVAMLNISWNPNVAEMKICKI